MEIVRDENKRIGLLVTILLHVLVFILFLIFGFIEPVPLPQDDYVEMELAGALESGGSPGDNNVANENEAVANNEASEATDATETETQAESEVNTNTGQNESNNDSQANSNNNNESTETDNVDESMGYSNSGGNNGQNGDTQGNNTGDDPFGTNGEGGGAGLGDRGILSQPGQQSTCEERGNVVVKIKVDRSGKVVEATALTNHRNTTNSDPCLIKDAEKKAKQFKYETNNSGPVYQYGEITLKFK